MKNCWLKKWEIALLMALCITFCTGAWAQRESEALSSSLVRLHVVAVSDDAEEQLLKLRVRDEVLDYLAPRLEGAEGADEARAVIEASLAGIEAAAAGAADGRDVTVTLGREAYPTREYDGFALPAGNYTSLRVVLGEGAGQNWWCVVFPPLCLTAAEAESAMETLSDDSAALISGESEGYVFKFKILELWGELTALLST